MTHCTWGACLVISSLASAVMFLAGCHYGYRGAWRALNDGAGRGG